MTISRVHGLDSQRLADLFARAEAVAADMTLPLFRTGFAVDNKLATGFDPVTEADTEAERVIREAIAEAYPDHAIIGEEWPDRPGTAPYTWIIDPIDGTRAFISGVPVWGTLVGLLHEGRAIAGMMAQPFSRERWIALDGTTLYGRDGEAAPVRTSTTTALDRAKLSTTAPEQFDTPARQAGWNAVAGRALQIRYGLDCYAYCLLASGHLDLVVEAGLKDVDIAPLIPIIEGAGGVVTTWDGGPAEKGGDCVAAATPALHAEALAVIAEAMTNA